MTFYSKAHSYVYQYEVITDFCVGQDGQPYI